MQGRFIVTKTMILIRNNDKSKQKNRMLISLKTEKTFGKI